MTNVDTAEIAKFEALASRWWDRNSEFKPLHDINPLSEHDAVMTGKVYQLKCIKLLAAFCKLI